MKESHREGGANRAGSESSGGQREGPAEALTGRYLHPSECVRQPPKNAGDDRGVVIVERAGVQAHQHLACADRRRRAVPSSSRSGPAGFLNLIVRILSLLEQGQRMMPTPPRNLHPAVLRAPCGVLAQLLCGKEPVARRATKSSPFFLLLSSLSPLPRAFGWQLLEGR